MPGVIQHQTLNNRMIMTQQLRIQ